MTGGCAVRGVTGAGASNQDRSALRRQAVAADKPHAAFAQMLLNGVDGHRKDVLRGEAGESDLAVGKTGDVVFADGRARRALPIGVDDAVANDGS